MGITEPSTARSVNEASNPPTIQVLNPSTEAAVPAIAPIGSSARLITDGNTATWTALATLNGTSHATNVGTPPPATVTANSAADAAAYALPAPSAS